MAIAGRRAVRSLLATCLLLFLLKTSAAAAVPTAAPPVEFPFQLRDGFIWVEVSVARTNQQLNFLVDTGAGVSVVDQRVVESLGLKLGQRVRVTGVQTTTTGFWPQRMDAEVGSVALPPELLAVDLGKLGRACATPVDGLLGADFFHGKVVQIDYRARVVRLLTSEQAKELKGESLALDIRGCGMRVPVRVNGRKPEWLRLDTGCATPLHWVTASVDPKLCRREPAIGLTELSLPTTAVTAELGAKKFEQIAAVIHEREIFAGEAGLLGNGLLAQFSSITVDAKAGRLILTK